MEIDFQNEKIRWLVIKAMLDEFPALRAKAKTYLKGKK